MPRPATCLRPRNRCRTRVERSLDGLSTPRRERPAASPPQGTLSHHLRAKSDRVSEGRSRGPQKITEGPSNGRRTDPLGRAVGRIVGRSRRDRASTRTNACSPRPASARTDRRRTRPGQRPTAARRRVRRKVHDDGRRVGHRVHATRLRRPLDAPSPPVDTNCKTHLIRASVAQWLARKTRNQGVAGSSPAPPTFSQQPCPASERVRQTGRPHDRLRWIQLPRNRRAPVNLGPGGGSSRPRARSRGAPSTPLPTENAPAHARADGRSEDRSTGCPTPRQQPIGRVERTLAPTEHTPESPLTLPPTHLRATVRRATQRTASCTDADGLRRREAQPRSNGRRERPGIAGPAEPSSHAASKGDQKEHQMDANAKQAGQKLPPMKCACEEPAPQQNGRRGALDRDALASLRKTAGPRGAGSSRGAGGRRSNQRPPK